MCVYVTERFRERERGGGGKQTETVTDRQRWFLQIAYISVFQKLRPLLCSFGQLITILCPGYISRGKNYIKKHSKTVTSRHTRACHLTCMVYSTSMHTPSPLISVRAHTDVTHLRPDCVDCVLLFFNNKSNRLYHYKMK